MSDAEKLRAEYQRIYRLVQKTQRETPEWHKLMREKLEAYKAWCEASLKPETHNAETVVVSPEPVVEAVKEKPLDAIADEGSKDTAKDDDTKPEPPKPRRASRRSNYRN